MIQQRHPEQPETDYTPSGYAGGSSSQPGAQGQGAQSAQSAAATSQPAPSSQNIPSPGQGAGQAGASKTPSGTKQPTPWYKGGKVRNNWLGKLLWNVPASAAASGAQWLKNRWAGKGLKDSVRKELVNLVENLFEQSEQSILASLDQFGDELDQYITKTLQGYQPSATAASSGVAGMPATTTLSSRPVGSTGTSRGPKEPSTIQKQGAEASIKAGKKVMPPVLKNLAMYHGITVPDDDPNRYAKRYNGLRRYWSTGGNSYPDLTPEQFKQLAYEPKSIDPEFLHKARSYSQARLETMSEKRIGRRQLKMLADKLGVDIGNARSEARIKPYLGQIYAALQDKNLVASPTSASSPTPVTPQAASLPAATPTTPAATATKPEPLDLVRQILGNSSKPAPTTTPVATPAAKEQGAIRSEPAPSPEKKEPMSAAPMPANVSSFTGRSPAGTETATKSVEDKILAVIDLMKSRAQHHPNLKDVQLDTPEIKLQCRPSAWQAAEHGDCCQPRAKPIG